MSASKGRIVSKISLRSYKKYFFPFLASISFPLAAAEPSLDFISGQALFEKNWVPAPASTTGSDGLGPYYNARSCMQCHPDGGRGDREQSLVVHIDDLVYGQQLQKYAVHGLNREAQVEFSRLRENTASELQPVTINITALSSGPLQNPAMSARLAPSLAGLGMLANIDDNVIIALADENDSDNDGISGRVQWINKAGGEKSIGRFGWKASQGSLRQQVAKALSLDLGIGNPEFPSPGGDCTLFQQQCLIVPDGNSSHHDNLEANELVVELLLTYVRGLPVPTRVNSPSIDKTAEKFGIIQGSQQFEQAGCANCHLPVIETSAGEIHPYTDLLLHDLGPGLADTLEQGVASGSEWRTAPLWGLGAIRTEYLHDGRANTVHEAILWHDGEAAAARENYLKLNKAALDDLNTFLNSL